MSTTMRSDGGGAPYAIPANVSAGEPPVVAAFPQVATTRRDNGDAGTDITHRVTTATVRKQ